MRFEINGDSRKEVHALVRINNELGVRQFARLNFDFNRSFQSVEIPLVRITHAKGGTSEILPTAITDNPNPAVVNFPAYQDVRVKSIRILGLAPGDRLEYRVVTTTTHHPLAPDFWFDHTFDRSGVVSHEIFELDLPKSSAPRTRFNPAFPLSGPPSPINDSERSIYRWDVTTPRETDNAEPDISVTTFASWPALLSKLQGFLEPKSSPAPEINEKAVSLTANLKTPEERVRAIYEFVSQKVVTIDLPLGATGFATRPAAQTLAAGYGTSEDKFLFFRELLGSGQFAVAGDAKRLSELLPAPSHLTHLLVVAGISPPPQPGVRCGDCARDVWLDLDVPVAPFGMVPANLRGKQALTGPIGLYATRDGLVTVPDHLPFPSNQDVTITANLLSDGSLSAKVHYKLRGDNELLLRLAFHQSPKEKWNEVAQLLALSDGFRGKVTSVTASDPYATRDPFTVEYEVVQRKFVDWTKTPVRIPAILPLLGLPDPPAEPGKSPIELGTPLDVHTSVTLHLPPGTSVEAPAGTSVARDYATFCSQYAFADGVITASRHIHFLERQIPAERAADYNAFLHAVQSDEAQRFTLQTSSSK